MTDHDPPGPGETAARDQKQAELRDLLRLHALMEPYAPDGSTDIKDILPVLPAADRAEAEGILDRIDLLAAERQRSLARLHHVEQVLRKLAEQGQPLIRDGQPVTDPRTGQVLKDPAFPGKVQAALEELRRSPGRSSRPRSDAAPKSPEPRRLIPARSPSAGPGPGGTVGTDTRPGQRCIRRGRCPAAAAQTPPAHHQPGRDVPSRSSRCDLPTQHLP